MVEIIAFILIASFFELAGGFFIFVTIDNFMRKKYFWFGVDLMITLGFVVQTVELFWIWK